jgi:hypothetical protein
MAPLPVSVVREMWNGNALLDNDVMVEILRNPGFSRLVNGLDDVSTLARVWKDFDFLPTQKELDWIVGDSEIDFRLALKVLSQPYWRGRVETPQTLCNLQLLHDIASSHCFCAPYIQL